MQVYSGTEIFAEAFGCEVHRPENNMPFALPLISSASEVAGLKVPELSTSSLAYLFDIGDELRRRAGDDALIGIDIQSPMDIAALIWNKNDFYAAMLETPEAVRELAHKVGDLLTSFLDEWFARYGREFMGHFPDYYMPYGITSRRTRSGWSIRKSSSSSSFLSCRCSPSATERWACTAALIHVINGRGSSHTQPARAEPGAAARNYARGI